MLDACLILALGVLFLLLFFMPLLLDHGLALLITVWLIEADRESTVR